MIEVYMHGLFKHSAVTSTYILNVLAFKFFYVWMVVEPRGPIPITPKFFLAYLDARPGCPNSIQLQCRGSTPIIALGTIALNVILPAVKCYVILD